MRAIGSAVAVVAVMASAGPAPAQVADGAVACYGRAYSAEHMAAHPGQSVVEMMVVLDNTQAAAAQGDARPWVGATIRAMVRDRFGEFFANFAICDWDAGAGSYACGIECDGGRFDIDLQQGSALLRNEDWGFVLYGGCGEDVEAGREVHIPADAEHAAFRLYPLPAEACPVNLWELYLDTPL